MIVVDPNLDFELFASAANYVKTEFEKANIQWQDSPFEWILRLPTGSKGKLGKKLVYQWCALKELSVDKCLDTQADMLINGHRIEVKFSTLWAAGFYRFQQIRDQKYEYAIFLGISPFEAHCWVVSKTLLRKYVIGHMGQHTGKEGKETAWLKVYPRDIPEWLSKCGGTLDQAFMLLRGLKRNK